MTSHVTRKSAYGQTSEWILGEAVPWQRAMRLFGLCGNVPAAVFVACRWGEKQCVRRTSALFEQELDAPLVLLLLQGEPAVGVQALALQSRLQPGQLPLLLLRAHLHLRQRHLQPPLLLPQRHHLTRTRQRAHANAQVIRCTHQHASHAAHTSKHKSRGANTNTKVTRPRARHVAHLQTRHTAHTSTHESHGARQHESNMEVTRRTH